MALVLTACGSTQNLPPKNSGANDIDTPNPGQATGQTPDLQQDSTDQHSIDADSQQPASHSSASTGSANNNQLQQPADTGLDATLLTNLLVANIASRRGQYDTGAQYLNRAIAQSEDSRIIADAIELLAYSRNYPEVIRLSKKLIELEPENGRVHLRLVDALLENGETQEAFELLDRMINKTTEAEPNMLFSISQVLAGKQSRETIDDFFEWADQQSENPKISLTAASLASRLEDDKRFDVLIDRTLEHAPGWEIPALLKIEALAAESLDLATDFSRRFLKEAPLANQVRIQYARLLVQNEKPKVALKELKKALKQNPDSLDARFTSGVLFYDQKAWGKSKAQFEAMLKQLPGDSQSQFYLAQIAIEQQEYQRAIIYLQQIDGPEYIDAQIMIAQALVKLNGMQAGFEYLERTGARTEEDQIRLILQQEVILRDHKATDQLLELLDSGLQRYPDHPDLLYSRGLVSAQTDDIEQVEADMRKIIQLQPDNAHAYNALGYTLADKTDRLDEALELIDKANTLLPNNPFILDSLGWVHFKKGGLETAKKLLNQAYSLSGLTSGLHGLCMVLYFFLKLLFFSLSIATK